MPKFISFLTLTVFSLTAFVAKADHVSDVQAELYDIEQSIDTIYAASPYIPNHMRATLAQRTRAVAARLAQAAEVVATPPAGWFQAQSEFCPNVCARVGMRSAISPEGAQCVSGENRAASAIGQVQFLYGCKAGCVGQPYSNAISRDNGYCYRPGQTKDNDSTDRTVGCYCQR